MNSLPGTGALRQNEQQETREALDSAFQISNYLKCNVNKETLAIMIGLVENGVRPEQVAMLVHQIKNATQ